MSQAEPYLKLEEPAFEALEKVLDTPYDYFRDSGGALTVFFAEEAGEDYDGPLLQIYYDDIGGHQPEHALRVLSVGEGEEYYNEVERGLSPGELPPEEDIEDMVREAVDSLPEF